MVRRGCGIVELVDWRIIGLVIKAQNDGATSGGLKLQCITIATFLVTVLLFYEQATKMRNRCPCDRWWF